MVQSKQDNPLPLFIIANPGRASRAAQEAALADCFSIRQVDPVYIIEETLEDPSEVDVAAFTAVHSRPPLIGEVGCALAHRGIYDQMAEDSIPWAVVLEEDAQVNSSEVLRSRVDVLTMGLPPGTATVVNLNGDALPLSRLVPKGPLPGTRKPAIPPFLTSAYVLNLPAARLLSAAQRPFRRQADWPLDVDMVNYLIDTTSTVTRVDRGPSTVDPTGARDVFTNQQRRQIWLWERYRHGRDHFSSPRDYWRQMLRPRLVRHAYTLGSRVPILRSPGI